MAVNTKALRARIRSVDSTMHITKAMELVASSKIRRAREQMERSRFFRSTLTEIFADLSTSDTFYSKVREGLPTLYIVIAGDRGLAGGYNNNVFKLAAQSLRPGDIVVPIGKRAVDYYTRRQLISAELGSYHADSMSPADCAALAQKLKVLYDNGSIGAIRLLSTVFVSMLTQEPMMESLLPLTPPDTAKNSPRVSVLYEPDAESVLAAIIPEYIAGVTYSALCESITSELAARRSAMDTATKNAEEMIETLNLQYNRARQSAITQEITEIVAGSGV